MDSSTSVADPSERISYNTPTVFALVRPSTKTKGIMECGVFGWIGPTLPEDNIPFKRYHEKCMEALTSSLPSLYATKDPDNLKFENSFSVINESIQNVTEKYKDYEFIALVLDADKHLESI
ncbi:uncharacterized protein L201_005635 [Kwoniella dendrophila CBS 6074]|uniref:Uncharacterized protein n=1 Tax=Kwoniella dendrophila CBS 6074 TaxID=1295534 RepID=A0AAX4K0P1_9TREE